MLVHRMQSDGVPVRVAHYGNVAVLANRGFFLHDFSTVGRGPFRFHRAVIAGEIDNGPVPSGWTVLHFCKGARRSGTFPLHWECPHIRDARSWLIQFVELRTEYALVELHGSIHVLYVDFKPSDWVALHLALRMLIEAARSPGPDALPHVQKDLPCHSGCGRVH